ncbi:MAG: hypothetical protein KUF82_04280 [Candidatus Thiodiazotropha sp. (ex Ctena orbiculata)]|nr:hypothetical protein [Candidatus Thiodiazotropha taylori]
MLEMKLGLCGSRTRWLRGLYLRRPNGIPKGTSFGAHPYADGVRAASRGAIVWKR